VRKQERQEDEGVFGPLMEANCLEPGFVRWLLVSKDVRGDDVGVAEAGHEGVGRVGDHRLDAGGEDGNVGTGVTDVGELVAEAGAECS